MASLSKKNVSLQLRSGASEALMINVPYGSTVTHVAWTVKDLADRPVALPRFTGQAQYSGPRAESDKDGFYIRAGDAPTYARLKVSCAVDIKPAKGAAVHEDLTAEIGFYDTWGGMAKSWYPYPEDYEVPWMASGDRQGLRAVVLLHELIALLPEEFRTAAGPIPIVRTTRDDSWRGGKFTGAHAPLFFDTIQISDRLVRALKDVPEVTPEDIRFVSIVCHEIGHAVTYRKCLWDLHHAMATVRKQSRQAPGWVAPLGWARDAIAYGFVLVGAVAQNVLAPQDVVSEFSEIAGWELTGWLARATRALQPQSDVIDLGQWLSGLSKVGQNHPVRPNLASGNSELGWAFGLQATAVAAERPGFDAAVDRLVDAQAALEKSSGADKAAAQAACDKAEDAYWKAQAALQAKAAPGGFVSDYATHDANEDMSETLTFYLMDAADLATQTAYYGDRANPVLRRKRKFFADQKYLPTRDFPPVKVGSLWRGLDSGDHLNLWKVEL